MADTDRLSKFHTLAERMDALHKRLEARADEFATRLDDIEKAEPVAFERAHAFLDGKQADLQKIDDTLAQLTNLPLAPSSPAQSSQPLPPPNTAPSSSASGAAVAAAPTPTIDVQTPPSAAALPAGVPANVAAALAK